MASDKQRASAERPDTPNPGLAHGAKLRREGGAVSAVLGHDLAQRIVNARLPAIAGGAEAADPVTRQAQ